MRSRIELTRHMLDRAYRTVADNLAHLTLDEALFIPLGGYRSVLGTLKHTAAWSHVYLSFAFDPQPRGWGEIDWPRGLRETVDPTQAYLDDLIVWFHLSQDRWMQALAGVTDDELDLPRSVHWGQRLPLFDVVLLIANHHTYHAGEINQLLAICRGEAWEEGEEVEENHVSTVGHRVKPSWQT